MPSRNLIFEKLIRICSHYELWLLQRKEVYAKLLTSTGIPEQLDQLSLIFKINIENLRKAESMAKGRINLLYKNNQAPSEANWLQLKTTCPTFEEKIRFIVLHCDRKMQTVVEKYYPGSVKASFGIDFIPEYDASKAVDQLNALLKTKVNSFLDNTTNKLDELNACMKMEVHPKIRETIKEWKTEVNNALALFERQSNDCVENCRFDVVLRRLRTHRKEQFTAIDAEAEQFFHNDGLARRDGTSAQTIAEYYKRFNSVFEGIRSGKLMNEIIEEYFVLVHLGLDMQMFYDDRLADPK